MRAPPARVGPLHVVAPLFGAVPVERGTRRVVPGLVDRELLGELGQGLPGPVLAVVLLADLVGRLRDAGLLEEVLVVVDERRVDRERDADLATEALAVGREDRRVDIAEVVARLLDVGLQVEQPVTIRIEPAEPDRSDDVRRIAGGDLGAEDVVRGGVLVDLEAEGDLVLGSLNAATTACSSAIWSG